MDNIVTLTLLATCIPPNLILLTHYQLYHLIHNDSYKSGELDFT